mgnify:CR=1 FL=1
MKFYSVANGHHSDGSENLAYFTTLKKAWAFNVKRLREQFKENKAAFVLFKSSYIKNFCPDSEIEEAKTILECKKMEKFSLPYSIDCEPGNMVEEHEVKPGVRALVEFLNGTKTPTICGDDMGGDDQGYSEIGDKEY